MNFFLKVQEFEIISSYLYQVNTSDNQKKQIIICQAEKNPYYASIVELNGIILCEIT